MNVETQALRSPVRDALGIDDRNFCKLKLSTRAKDKSRPRVEITIYFETIQQNENQGYQSFSTMRLFSMRKRKPDCHCDWRLSDCGARQMERGVSGGNQADWGCRYCHRIKLIFHACLTRW
jgi:hypothetical protein